MLNEEQCRILYGKMIGDVFMKDYSEIRGTDDLGRVAIPKDIRREMRIKEGQLLHIYTAQMQGEDCICIKPIKE